MWQVNRTKESGTPHAVVSRILLVKPDNLRTKLVDGILDRKTSHPGVVLTQKIIAPISLSHPGFIWVFV
ncbi:MAG: hypothetical protein GKR95_19465 [Gammaproteobacteria bacterium]|nr:hypothetical protein [Gammaproteobacteria bacterium]